MWKFIKATSNGDIQGILLHLFSSLTQTQFFFFGYNLEYLVGKKKNHVLYNGGNRREVNRIVEFSASLLKEFQCAQEKVKTPQSAQGSNGAHCTLHELDTLKLNVDASWFVGRTEVETSGDHQGVIHGAMLKHYSGNISIETTELLAICDGTKFLLALGYRSLIVESDAVNVVNSIKNKCILSSKGSIIVEVELLKVCWW